MNEISQKIRAAREKKGWSQEGLALACNCSLKTIYRAESTPSKISKETLNRIASELKVELNPFFEKGQLQLTEIKTSHLMIQSIIDSIPQRNHYSEEKFQYIFESFLLSSKGIDKKLNFQLDNFNSEQLPPVIEFVNLIEQLIERQSDFKLTSELLKSQYELNSAIEKLNSIGIVIFYRIKKDRMVWGGHRGLYNSILECGEVPKPHFHEIITNEDNDELEWIYNELAIPIFYLLDSKNPDIKLKNNQRYIIVENTNYSYLKYLRKSQQYGENFYLTCKPYFSPEEQKILNKRFAKEIQEISKKENRLDEDEFPF